MKWRNQDLPSTSMLNLAAMEQIVLQSLKFRVAMKTSLMLEKLDEGSIDKADSRDVRR